MLDKLVDRHKNPLNQILHLAALVVGVYGLWNHDWVLIIVAVVVAIVGHMFPHKK